VPGRLRGDHDAGTRRVDRVAGRLDRDAGPITPPAKTGSGTWSRATTVPSNGAASWISSPTAAVARRPRWPSPLLTGDTGELAAAGDSRDAVARHTGATDAAPAVAAATAAPAGSGSCSRR
jgi:hypothetical protein